MAIQQCVLIKGNLFVKHHNVRKDLQITSTTALVPLGMFPEKRYAFANSPCTRAAYSLVCNYKAKTGKQCTEMASEHRYPWSTTVNGPNLVRQFVVDLSSCAKEGKPYWAWSVPSIPVLIASVDAAARALLKWYIPLSVRTYTHKGGECVVTCHWQLQNENEYKEG